MGPHQTNLQPHFFLFNFPLRFNLTPTFLGVTFGRNLSKHVSLLKVKFLPRLKVLLCIAAFSWGPSKESFYLVYKAFLRLLLTYALCRSFLFLSLTNFTKLECLHLAASRAISGCYSSSPIPLLLSEVSLLPLRDTLTRFALSSYERALRFPTSFPISDLARLKVKRRLSRSVGLLRLLTRSCFLLGRFSLHALLILLENCLPSLWSSPFPPMLPL